MPIERGSIDPPWSFVKGWSKSLLVRTRKIKVGRCCLFRLASWTHFRYAYEFLHSHTRLRVRLLGPCFKTGQIKLFRQIQHRSLRPHCSFESRRSSQTLIPATRPQFAYWLRKSFWAHAQPISFFIRFLFNDFKSFNPLFKVLFIFPSQYLFAIGFS